jgi:prepilin-type N-terminal cleavage/methylation domain-containing protein
MPMKMHNAKSRSGFSLLEMMIAMSLGVMIILLMTSLFKSGMQATMMVTQRAETQQNMRVAIEMMTKDLGLAGAGLPSGGLQLATAAGPINVGCNQGGTCYVPGATYPNSGTGTINFMYGILPGFNRGVQNGVAIPSAPGLVNDSITSIYCDYNFPLTNFSFTFPSVTQANVAVVNNAVQPNFILAPGGLNVGDLLLFIVSTPGNGTGSQGTSLVQTATAVGEITGIPNGNTINLAANDALNFNQTGPNSIANVAGAFVAGTTMSVCRLNAVTYFLQVPAAGGTVQTPRLMRQVNGLNAVPVADNIINLQFTFDVINSVTGTMSANQQDPIGAGLSPALIQKVNILVMGQSLTNSGKNAQSMYLASSVSASNMSFCNSYSSSTTVCQ